MRDPTTARLGCQMECTLLQLVTEDDSKALVFVLGQDARRYFEEELPASPFEFPSPQAVANSRQNVGVMFLDKLQYLYMYLTKLEVDEAPEYSTLVVYGLEQLLDVGGELSADQVRLASLIYNTAFRVKLRHGTAVRFLAHGAPHAQLQKLEAHWRLFT
ncbi:AaceriABR011Wp [[Ashbya] aceris (nom. inval.)]|nr:AaceriABR011Wp [[Ashbya] aceris (nom. inval.)]